jgi:hypothetical protein
MQDSSTVYYVLDFLYSYRSENCTILTEFLLFSIWSDLESGFHGQRTWTCRD